MMNGDNSKLAFNDWSSTSPRSSIPQCSPPTATVTCNVAHTTAPQDELLLRTKAQWEKQQAAAAAAMCYWGYSEPNPLIFTKNDWNRPVINTERTVTVASTTSESIDNGQIQIPRLIEQTTTTTTVVITAAVEEQADKTIREPRLAQIPSSSAKKRSRAPPVCAPTVGSCDGAGPSVNKPFPCADCGKSFRQHSQLLTHQRTHTGDRPYLCTDCPKAFRTQGTLAIHRRIHTGEKPYTCEECTRTFRTQGTLVIHRRTHSGDRPYKCQDCGKAFAARCSLVVHWRTHTGEKPYMCTECGKLFASRSDSARHTRTHQPGSNGKKPYIRRIIQQHPALQ